MSVTIIENKKIELLIDNKIFNIVLKNDFEEIKKTRRFTAYDIEEINGEPLMLCKINDLHIVYNELKKIMNL